MLDFMKREFNYGHLSPIFPFNQLCFYLCFCLNWNNLSVRLINNLSIITEKLVIINICHVLTVTRQLRDLQYQLTSTAQQQPTSLMIGTRQPSTLQGQSLETTAYPGSGGDSVLNWCDSGDKCSCPICKRHFHNPANMKRHLKIHLNDRRYKCIKCSTGFYRADHLKIHESKCRGLLRARTSKLPTTFWKEIVDLWRIAIGKPNIGQSEQIVWTRGCPLSEPIVMCCLRKSSFTCIAES